MKKLSIDAKIESTHTLYIDEGANWVKWVHDATSQDALKPVFTEMYKEGNTLVSSDSRRMHVLTLDEFAELPDGFYHLLDAKRQTVVLQKVAIDGQFPDYKKIVQDESDQSRLLPFSVKHAPTFTALATVTLLSGTVCNSKYLDDALRVDVREGTVYRPAQAHEPVQISFMNGAAKAVVMPIQMRYSDSEAESSSSLVRAFRMYANDRAKEAEND